MPISFLEVWITTNSISCALIQQQGAFESLRSAQVMDFSQRVHSHDVNRWTTNCKKLTAKISHQHYLSTNHEYISLVGKLVRLRTVQKTFNCKALFCISNYFSFQCNSSLVLVSKLTCNINSRMRC